MPLNARTALITAVEVDYGSGRIVERLFRLFIVVGCLLTVGAGGPVTTWPRIPLPHRLRSAIGSGG